MAAHYIFFSPPRGKKWAKGHECVSTLALWGKGMVPAGVTAVVINHVVVLGPPHRRVLLRAEARAGGRGGRRSAVCPCVGRAAGDLEVGEPGDERLVTVVDLVPAVLSSPRRRVPDGAVHPHWTEGERRVTLPWVPTDWDVVDEEPTRAKETLSFYECIAYDIADTY